MDSLHRRGHVLGLVLGFQRSGSLCSGITITKLVVGEANYIPGSTNAFTLLHVLVSLFGLAAGLVMVGGWLAVQDQKGWAVVFLIASIATNVTGYFFSFKGGTLFVILGVTSVRKLKAA